MFSDKTHSDTRDLRSLAMVESVLDSVGVTVNKAGKYVVMVNDWDRFARALFTFSNLHVGEAFMANIWDADDLSEIIYRALQVKPEGLKGTNTATLLSTLGRMIASYLRPSDLAMDAARHYNEDPELFRHQLGPTGVYSCAYYGRGAQDLDSAQEAKLQLICEKLKLKPGMRVLDIGCGWGTLAAYMAKNYGVSVVGITVSDNQVEGARQRCQGLDVEIRKQNYLDLKRERFHRIASVGMFEHVRSEHYRKYFEIVSRCLEDDGLFLLHTIGCLVTKRSMDPWIDKHVFPGSQLPCLFQIGKAIERLFVPEDLHNFGADYDRTLMAWWHNFDAHWEEIRHRFGDDASQRLFYRKRKYYLQSCAGAFRARNLQLYQIVLSKGGVPGGYAPVR